MRIVPLGGALLVFFGPSANAQEPAPTGTVEPAALRVFIDCVDHPCDEDFFRTEVAFVDHVRDRSVSELHLQVSRDATGGGGFEYTLRFIGRERFAGESFVLRHASNKTESADDLRRSLAHRMKLGLVRFVAETPLGERVTIAFAPDGEEASRTLPLDPWNGWVFDSTLYGFFNGEAQSDYTSTSLSASASRVTHAWKWKLSAYTSYDERTFRYDSFDANGNPIEVKITSIRRDHTGYGRLVRSLSPRWSASVNGSVSRSTFTNKDHELNSSGGFEYSLFPYSESASRFVAFRWFVGGRRVDYEEETIFEKNREILAYESAALRIQLIQPWGTVATTLHGSHYFHDVTKNQASLDTSLNLRILGGLSFNAFGNVALVRDQLYLPAAGATEAEVLLQRKQLATNYRYFASIGLSYTFGSIFNNIVNPRFD